MPKRKIGEVDPGEEEKAEAEVAAAFAASDAAPADEKIAGLGPSTAGVCFKVTPTGPRPKQYKAALHWEKPLVLVYFAIKGLGEVPRLMLAEAGVAYDHICAIFGEPQSTVCDWRARSPTGLLPMLSGLGVPRSEPLSQSSAIIRFLARRFGFTGATELEEAAADIMFETALDLGKLKDVVAAMPAKEDQDPAAKGPWALALRLEKMLSSAPAAEDHSVALTYGQVQLFFTLSKFEDMAPGCVKHMSATLDEFRLAMSARPQIQAYAASKMCFPWTLGELGKDGGYTYVSGPLTRGDLK